ncbi:MAG: GNAT family N-acetyltransferase [Devosia sp.]|nr:GNAT family N-acetyltransferase [Devosia sp.]
MIEFRIEQEDPRQPAVRELIAELNAYLLTLSPPEACYHMTAEEMAEAATTVFVARTPEGPAIAIGALRREGEGIGEVKRMYTRPEARGKHVGSSLLDRIVDLARREGIERLVLETGDRHPEAWVLYESRGFTRCGPVLDYPESQWSVFYEKPLREPATA